MSVIHRATFGAVELKNIPIIAEPYIASFCSHASDGEYERSHGLLSQWRGYGGVGGYCIVFDTSGLISLLSGESRNHFWSYMNMDAVTYSNDQKNLERYANEIARRCRDCAHILLNGKANSNFDDLLPPFLHAATHIKHQGFREEREVRIVVSPKSNDQMETLNEPVRSSFEEVKRVSPTASFKTIHTTLGMQKRRYLALFDSIRRDFGIYRSGELSLDPQGCRKIIWPKR